MSSIGSENECSHLPPPESPAGKHLLVEYSGCDANILSDLDLIKDLMVSAASQASVHVLTTTFHRFKPQGVTGVVVIAESHLSIHTWPEHHYAAVDFFTCGAGLPEVAERFLRDGLGAKKVERLLVTRGAGLSVNFLDRDNVNEQSSVQVDSVLSAAE